MEKKIKSALIFVGTGLLAILAVWVVSSGFPLFGFGRHAGPGKIAPYLLVRQPTGDLDRQIAFYRVRIQQDPEGFLNLIELAQLYLQRAKASGENSWYLLAEQAARRSLANFQNNPAALLVLARVAIARHDFQEALNLTQRVAAKKPSDLGVHSNLVTIYLGRGDVHKAAQSADFLVNHEPGLEAYTQRALVSVALGKEQQAIADFLHGIGLEQAGQMDGSAQARFWLGRLYAHRGQLDGAEDLYHEALRIVPRHPLALSLLADLEMRQRHFEDADKHYAEAFMHSQLPILLLSRAHARHALGDNREAEALRKQAESLLRRDLQSGSFGHRRDLAQLLLESGQPAKTKEALGLMQAEIKQRQDSQTLNVLAWSLAQSGQWTEAQEKITQALATGIRDAELLYRAGQIAAALGKASDAQHYFETADKLDPNFKFDPAYTHFRRGSS